MLAIPQFYVSTIVNNDQNDHNRNQLNYSKCLFLIGGFGIMKSGPGSDQTPRPGASKRPTMQSEPFKTSA